MDDHAQYSRGPSVRRLALQRVCPTCGALPLGACVGPRGKVRVSVHADRIAQARGQRPA